MKTTAIIQARMNSTRLPGKVLKKVLNKTLLEYQIERVKRATNIDEIIIATTRNTSDDPIVELCNSLSIPFYRGSEDDVLSRYYEAAKQFNADIVVRLTSDCPVIDPEVIDKVINFYLNNYIDYDYVSNTMKRTYPRGLDTEVFSIQALKKVYESAAERFYREHVTTYIYRTTNEFKLGNVENNINLSQYRLTVDTIEDFELIKLIIERLYPINQGFKLIDIINILKEYPRWLKINSHIEQKS
ncbi:spore coat protein [Pullulanibacillus camelliae]|uniref:Spore coat protein n=1 Tax=Pullulanibacillus camelliae TaxID=1707096 RepID=A0A8J2VPT3_9BACL|nr:glycosyltransferase family protein [Pullulanibacillus camelliae]GGE36246.1 spore coat protein [Pullulanibacillus camelliae]